MSLLAPYYFWAILLISSLLPDYLQAQKPAVDVYRIQVTTKAEQHFRGILNDIDDTTLYIGRSARIYPLTKTIPLNAVRKVVIRRVNKKGAIITGAILGGLLTGYLSHQSLQKNQPNSPVTYGITLTFAAAGGAAAGLLVGSAAGSLSRRVIRPLSQTDPELSLFRQLEPFSVRYQQEFINRLPKTN